jgi:hypothetical protein
MKCSVFVGISVDGFMARKDGAIDFLPGDDCEPHGFEEFWASVDAVVIGRKTTSSPVLRQKTSPRHL